MKIIIYSLSYAPEMTGVGKFTGEMAVWLAARGHQVRVVTGHPFYPQWQVWKGYAAGRYRRERRDGVDIWRCPVWIPRQPNGLRRLLLQFSFALSSIPVTGMQIFWRPRMVMALEPPLAASFPALFLARLCAAKTWLNIKDLEVDAAFDLGMLQSPVLRRLAEACERWLMRRYDCISTIAEPMRRRIRQKGARDNVILFRDWIDIHAVRPDPLAGQQWRQQCGISPEQTVVLYSGNLGKKQGLDIVPQMARLLAPGILLLICGDGPLRQELEQAAASLPNLMLRPLVPSAQLNALLNAADIHFLPQRAEAADLVMPSKLLNMLAAGGSVVATASPDSELGAAVLAAGGRLSPPGDPAAAALALNQFAHSAALREQAGKLARDYALRHFSQQDILLHFESQLFSMLNSSSRMVPRMEG